MEGRAEEGLRAMAADREVADRRIITSGPAVAEDRSRSHGLHHNRSRGLRFSLRLGLLRSRGLNSRRDLLPREILRLSLAETQGFRDQQTAESLNAQTFCLDKAA